MNRAQKKLDRQFFDAGMIILSVKAYKDVTEFKTTLGKTAEKVRGLRAELDDAEYAEAFAEFWRRNARKYEPFFELGVDPDSFSSTLWNWAQTQELPYWQ